MSQPLGVFACDTLHVSFENPFRALLRDACLSLPRAVEQERWGHPIYTVDGKIFIASEFCTDFPFGFAFKHTDPHPFLADRRIFVSTWYDGGKWLGFDCAIGDCDWDYVAGIVGRSHELTKSG